MGSLLTTDLQFMRSYEAVARYVKAFDDWEGCIRNVSAGPNDWGQVREPTRLRSSQMEFIEARNGINHSIRRATEITRRFGRAAPYASLLDLILETPANPFWDESQLSSRTRILVHDVVL